MIKDNNKYYNEAKKVIHENFPKRLDKPSLSTSVLNNLQFQGIMNQFPGIVCIIDGSRNHVYISNNIKGCLGYHPEDFEWKNLDNTIILYPIFQHHIIFQNIFPTVTEHIYRYAKQNAAKDLKASYTSLLKHKNGEYRWFHHQLTILETNELDEPILLLKVLTDIHELKKDDSISLSISKRDKDGIYFTIFSHTYVLKDKVDILSLREVEILNLIAQGKSSSEISDLLSISPHTVYKHRKNMLKKMQVKRTGELLKIAMANGII